MSIENYNNKEKVHACAHNDCLIEIFANVVRNQHEVTIKVSFEYKGVSNIDDVYVNSIQLFGFNESLE